MINNLKPFSRCIIWIALLAFIDHKCISAMPGSIAAKMSVDTTQTTGMMSNSLAAGKLVPDFEVKVLGSNDKVSNKCLLGKYYLLDFWMTGCSGCLDERLVLEKLYPKYRHCNFEILSLSFDSRVEDIESFRRNKWEMPWLHTRVEDGFMGKLARRFEIKYLPKLILVGPDGKIIASENLNGQNLGKILKLHLEK